MEPAHPTIPAVPTLASDVPSAPAVKQDSAQTLIPFGSVSTSNPTTPVATPPPSSFYDTPSPQEVQEMQPVATIQSVPLTEHPLGKEVNLFTPPPLAEVNQKIDTRLQQLQTDMPAPDPRSTPAIVLPTNPQLQPSSDLNKIYSQVQNHGAERFYKIFLSLLILALLILGAQSLARAMIFIFVDFPALEEAFYGHQYGETSLIQFAIGSGMLISTSALSFFFALQYVTHFRQWRSYLFAVFGILLIAAGILAVIVTPSLSLQSYR